MEPAEGGHRADSVRISREVPNAGVSHNTLLLHPLYFGSQFPKNLIITSLVKGAFLTTCQCPSPISDDRQVPILGPQWPQLEREVLSSPEVI